MATLVGGVSHAAGASYTYTPAGATEAWSTGSGWDATPVSDANTTLTFVGSNSTALSPAFTNTNTNDLANPFELNVLNLQGTGPGSGTTTINIGGDALKLVSHDGLTPVVNLNALKGSGTLNYNVSNPLILDADTRVTGNGTANFTFSGPLTAANSVTLTKSGSSTLTLTGDSSSTFSGDISITGGSIRLHADTGGKLASSTKVDFRGAGGSFVLFNQTGGGDYEQTLEEVRFLSGHGVVDTNRPSGGNIAIVASNWSRSTGAIASFSTSNGSAGSTSTVRLKNGGTAQAAGFIDSATFHRTGAFGMDAYAWYVNDENGGFVRAMNYGSDADTQTRTGDLTGSTSIVTGDKHTQITAPGTASNSSTVAAAASNSTSLTVADGSIFQVGQPIRINNVATPTLYVVAKSGNTLTLSQPVTAALNVQVTGTAGIYGQDSISLKTLLMGSTNAGASLRLNDGAVLSLTENGIMYRENAPQFGAIISGGAKIAPAADKEMVFMTANVNSNLVVATPIDAGATTPVTKGGAGLLRLEAENTFKGGLYVNGGTLDLLQANTVENGIQLVSGPTGALTVNLHKAGALGEGSSTNTITSVEGTNTVWLRANNATFAHDIIVESGTLRLRSTQNDVRFTGNLVIQAGASLSNERDSGSNNHAHLGNNGQSTVTFGPGAGPDTALSIGGAGSGERTNFAGLITSTVTGSGPRIKNIQNSPSSMLDLRVNPTSGDSYDFGGTIETYFTLTKNGEGTQALSGDNIYQGTTTVNAGALLVRGTHSGAGAYTVNAGGTLGGDGTITTADNAGVTIASGGRLAPGASPGTLTLALGAGSMDISGAVGGANTGALVFELGAIDSSDQVLLTSGSLNIGDGVLNLDDFDFTFLPSVESGTYTLFDTSMPIMGSLDTNPANLMGSFGTGRTMQLTLSGDSQDLLLIVAVPEPASLSLVALGAVGLLRRRRRSVHR